jgi:membrane protein required for colicin V production
MVIVDYILLGAFLVSVGIGLVRGFFREAMSLVTWLLAAWLAWRYSWLVEPLLSAISSDALRLWLGRLIAFVAVLLIGGIVGHLVARLVQKSGLSGTDRALGMVFGAARGLLDDGLLVLEFQQLEMDREPWWEDSVVVPHGTRIAEWLRAFMDAGVDRIEEAVAVPPE